jgi:hypothetical protein
MIMTAACLLRAAFRPLFTTRLSSDTADSAVPTGRRQVLDLLTPPARRMLPPITASMSASGATGGDRPDISIRELYQRNR